MRSSQLRKLYIFFSGYLSFEPDSAHEIHDVLCANAAASLGYDSVLVYLDRKNKSFNPVRGFTLSNLNNPMLRL